MNHQHINEAENMGGICEIATSAPGYTSAPPKDKAPLAMTLKLNGYSTAQFGVQVIKIAKEFVEAMHRRQEFIFIAQVVLAELTGGLSPWA
jgi:arylsulfatase A-like enzyme